MSQEFSASLPVNDEVLAVCDFGDLTGKDLDNMLRQDQADEGKVPCPECTKSFTTRPNMLRHQRSMHGDKRLQCPDCSKTFARIDKLKCHLDAHKRKAATTPLPTSKQPRLDIIAATSTSRLNTGPIQQTPGPSTSHAAATSVSDPLSAFEGRVKNIGLPNDDHIKDLRTFLELKREDFVRIVSSHLADYDLKVNCRLLCRYRKVTSSGIVSEVKNFKTKNVVILTASDLNEVYGAQVDKILAEADDFEGKDSGWVLEEIINLEIWINKYSPLRGSSYIELPPTIKAKQAIINVENKDNRCFMWAVLSALHPVQDYRQHAPRCHHYEAYIPTLDFTGIEFPVKLQDVRKFEKLNDISINVYGITEENKIYPRLITEAEQILHVDLIYLTNASFSHYAWIKDLSRLLSKQYSKHNGKQLICRRCLQFFQTEPVLQRHKLSCSQHEAVRVQMPEDKWLSFKNIKHTHPVPFVIYADFECLTRPLDTCQPNSKGSYSEAYQKHEPISFCYYIASTAGPYKEPFIYRGPNAEKVFMERMKLEAEDIHRIYKHPLPMDPLTEEQQRVFDTATNCYMCKEKFSTNNYKVHYGTETQRTISASQGLFIQKKFCNKRSFLRSLF